MLQDVVNHCAEFNTFFYRNLCQQESIQHELFLLGIIMVGILYDIHTKYMNALNYIV